MVTSGITLRKLHKHFYIDLKKNRCNLCRISVTSNSIELIEALPLETGVLVLALLRSLARGVYAASYRI